MRFSGKLSFLIVLISSVQILAYEHTERRNRVVDKCRKELNSPQDAVDIIGTKKIPQTEAQRCFFECMFKYGKMIINGQFNYERALQVAKLKFGHDEETLTKVNDVLNECNTKYYADPSEKCSLGKKLRECFFNNLDSLKFYPLLYPRNEE